MRSRRAAAPRPSDVDKTDKAGQADVGSGPLAARKVASVAQLDHLLAEVRACRICRERPRKSAKPLPHEPRPVLRVSVSARICICGQAPGTKVHASGKPFTDPSGQRLRQWMGVRSREFYDLSRVAIIPMGFCFPGQNSKGADLPPRRECSENWHDRLFAQLPEFELLLLVGRYAQLWHLGSGAGASLTECVRDWRRHSDPPAGHQRIFPLPHPSWRNNAWIKKHSWFEAELLPVLRQQVLAALAEG